MDKGKKEGKETERLYYENLHGSSLPYYTFRVIR